MPEEDRRAYLLGRAAQAIIPIFHATECLLLRMWWVEGKKSDFMLAAGISETERRRLQM